MECRNIREKLSAYIDDILSAREKMAVDEHLKSCPECATVLADLRKTVEYMKSLETVEPPPWLMQKVMAKVRAEAQMRKGLFRKLFYPLHTKLPVGAIATVLVVGLALYIYRDIVPEIRLAQAPVEKQAPQASQTAQQPSPKYAEDKGVTPPTLPLDEGRSRERLPLKEGEKGFAGKIAPATETPLGKQIVSKEMDAKADKLAQSGVQEPEKKEETKVPAPAKRPDQLPAAGAIARDEVRQAGRAVAPEAKLSYMEKKKEEPFVFTVFVKDPETAVKEIEKILKDIEGKTVRTESAEGKKVITATMNVGRLHQLFERMKVIGEIKEKELDIKGQEGDVMVRIELTVVR